MRLTLYQRLALLIVTLFLAIFGGFTLLSSHLQHQAQLEAEQQLHLGLASHLVDDNPLLAEGVYDYAGLQNLFHMLMILGPAFEFYYLDPQGKILTYSAEEGKVKRQSVDLAPVHQLLESAEVLPVVGDDPRHPDRQKIFSAAPVYKDGALQGYLYMIIGGEIYDSVWAPISNDKNLQQWLWMGAAGTLFLLLVGLILLRWLTSPLRRLNQQMALIQRQGFEQPRQRTAQWPSHSHNEIDQLGARFDAMVAHIQQQFSQLQNLDQQRRRLLADLSHDLRTPLASLQGYIETLAISDHALSDQERQRFIQTALKNANNLKKLIDQIFELSYLQGGQVTLNQEPFPLGELIHDVVAKFFLHTEQKGIDFKVNPDQLNYRVVADIAKLERVLTNLLDNAIRHTPAGGQISISIEPVNQQRLRIELSDTGVGINESEIAFIFDARYQAANSVKDKQLHAGLGLAICKKLMALLGSDLKVSSKIGQGTKFSFELSRALSP